MKCKVILLFILVIAWFPMLAVRAGVQNGVVTTHFDHSSNAGEYVNHYINYNPTSVAFVYNDAGGSAFADGGINLKAYKGARHVTIDVETLGSTSITVRIEGRTNGATIWSVIYDEVFTAVGSKTINILEKTDYIRMGILVVGNGVDDVTVRGTYHSKTQD